MGPGPTVVNSARPTQPEEREHEQRAPGSAPAPLRVAVLAESYLPYLSGVTVSTEALVRGLGARGHRVLLVAPRPRAGAELGTAGAVGPDPEVAWMPSYQLPPPVPRGYRMPLPATLERVLPDVMAFRPQVVHAQSPFMAGLFARRIARKAGAPLVFTYHTRFVDYRHYMSAFADVGAAVMRRYLDGYLRSCDAVIAPSRDLAAELRQRLDDPARPLIEPVPTGIDVGRLAQLEATSPRAAHGWSDDAIVAVTAGRLAPEKSVETVLEGFSRASAREPRLRLVVIGDGPSAPRLRERAASSGLTDRVAFLGQLPRLEALAVIKGCDVFLFASQTETQGLVLVESLACGVPVIAVAAPGVRDSVTDGVDGRIVAAEPKEARASAIAAALFELARDAQTRASMARAALAGAGHFSVAERLAQVEAVYRAAIEVRSGRATP